MLKRSLVLFVLPAVISISSFSVGAALAAEFTVETRDFKFVEATISVTAGDTVIFKNTGQAPHNAVASDGSFDTGLINPGESRTVTAAGSGDVPYVCTFHEAQGMRGVITVIATAGAPATGSTSPTPIPGGSQAPPAGAAVPGQEAVSEPSPDERADAAEEPETPVVPTQKYFPAIIGAMALLLVGLVGSGYVRMVLKATHNRTQT